MSKPKRYRLKRNEFEVVGTRFESLEAGPVVVLQPADFDVKEVGLAEFKADYEEVPEGEGKRGTASASAIGAAEIESIEMLAEFIDEFCGHDTAYLWVDGSGSNGVSIGSLSAILDAARKSLGGEGEPAERCRVGEWLPGRYINPDSDLALKKVLCIGVHDEVGLTVTSGNPFTDWGWKQGYVDNTAWDAARARWFADGRPTS